MPDTATQIRDYYEGIVVRVTADEILDPAQPIASPVPPRRLPGALVAVAAAALVLVLVGSLGFWLASSEPSIEPATTPPVTEPAVEPPPTLPSIALNDVPAFEALVRYDLGGRDGAPVGGVAEVLFSYQPPDSYRREILALDPPGMDFWRGEVGDVVASEGTFPIVTGETTEEGEVLNALVWSNWEHRCATPPVPVETTTPGRTFTTISCEDPDDPWMIVVDRNSGLVVQATAELHGDDFTIPGVGLEIISVAYEPEYAAGWFETPQPDGPANPGEPFVYTFTEKIGGMLVGEVTWQDDATWRLDVLSGTFGSLVAGGYQIYTGQTLFTYAADTNDYNEERFPTMNRGLVAENCSEDGTCTHDDIEIVCDVTPDGRILGRPVTRYDCDWPPPYTPSTTWVDDELGYVLKTEDGFEVLAIDLDPVIDPALFEQVCPTSDCTLVDSS